MPTEALTGDDWRLLQQRYDSDNTGTVDYVNLTQFFDGSASENALLNPHDVFAGSGTTADEAADVAEVALKVCNGC